MTWDAMIAAELDGRLRVMNGYAGIGGNRHLWPAEWQVTAVEWDARIAAEYARRFPQDTVIVGDAHAFVMDHAAEFDACWVSPPCPTHSTLAPSVAARLGRELKPDPRLWEEIAFLQSLGGRYVVENVHTYYTPPIPPDVVTERHYYWVSAQPDHLLTPQPTRVISPRSTADLIADTYGLPRLPKGAVKDPRGTMRNAVQPVEGLEIAMAAFAAVLEPTEQ